MSATYREIAPPPRLAPFVECVWTREVAADYCERVLPDGCVDILLSRTPRGRTAAAVVGAMTRPHLVPLEAGTTLLGVRFHPGMAACLACDLEPLQNRTIPLAAVWGEAERDLVQGVQQGQAPERIMDVLEERLTERSPLGRVERALGELTGRRGQLTVEDLARAAGTSERQLRRTCLRQTGLAPKQLARILRFRHAAERLTQGRGREGLATVAAACGYADQAHMTRDFRALAGLTPGRFALARPR